MPDSTPTIEEWRRLYRAADQFKREACWNWMEDDDIFGVKNPEGGEIGYCVVIGALGESFGLVVYLGSQGLLGCYQVLEGEVRPDEENTLHTQRCLMASFEDRTSLAREDLKIIKESGHTFRGRNAWPLFRQYTPGYHPWFLHGGQVRFLTHALEQAQEVASLLKEDPSLLLSHGEEKMLVRTPSMRGSDLEWEDRWIVPDLEIEEEDSPLNEIQLQKVKSKAKQSDTFWIADLFYSPSPVQDKKGERPYYPLFFLLVDGGSGMIYDCQILKEKDHIPKARHHFLNTIESTGSIPSLLLLEREELQSIFLPLGEKLGFSIQIDEDSLLAPLKEDLLNRI